MDGRFLMVPVGNAGFTKGSLFGLLGDETNTVEGVISRAGGNIPSSVCNSQVGIGEMLLS